MSVAQHDTLLPPTMDPWHQATGQVAETGTWRTLVPFVAEFLVTRRPPTCDIYRRRASGTFRRMLSAGEEVPAVLARALARRTARKHYFVLLEDRDAMVRYQEDVMDDLMATDTIDLESKCRLIHNLTARLAEQILESPIGLNVFRQSANVARMVEFAQAYPEAAKALVSAVPREYSVVAHSVNVGFYSLLMLLNHFHYTSRDTLQDTALAFFLHDLGKTRLRKAIIEKPGPLNPSEWQQMRRHPVQGEAILDREQVLTSPARIVLLQHHERMDGRGYPDAIAGDEIHPFARICALADAFDSLTTDHPFRRGIHVFEALNIMRAEVRKQFDPELFRSFVLEWKHPFRETV